MKATCKTVSTPPTSCHGSFFPKHLETLSELIDVDRRLPVLLVRITGIAPKATLLVIDLATDSMRRRALEQ